MPEDSSSPTLTDGARTITDRAAYLAASTDQALSAHHWLMVLLDRHGPMIADLAGLDARDTRQNTEKALADGDLGEALPLDTVLERAQGFSAARGADRVSERDLARVILTALGYRVDAPSDVGSRETTTATAHGQGPSAGPRRAAPPTPTLEKLGRDLTAEARAGKLLQVVGRDQETSLVIETLCRRTKRNPALVGPAGVGKTAIVEGLAQRIVAGDVPEHLRDCRVLAIQPSSIVAGASHAGQFEERMEKVIAEARQPGIILFIDEVHNLIGTGGRTGSTDAAALLKPALARGDMACIAATTDDEYRRWIEPDGALERRFQPIRVQELTREQSAVVLRSVRDDLGSQRGVSVPDDVLEWLLDASIRYLRNRYLPDKAIDLLEQTIAHAVTIGESNVDVDFARHVAERMVGMPTDDWAGVQGLSATVDGHGLMGVDEAEALVSRLQVTLRGLDISPARPNAVLLLAGEAATRASELVRVIARELFGAAERVVEIDLGPMTNDEDITSLLGAPPAYVGYSDALPLHRVSQMPWCVLRLSAVDACHPLIRETVARALADGFFTDAQGRRIYLSDAVVVLTAAVDLSTARPIGFGASEHEQVNHAREAVARALGSGLANQCDIICGHAPHSRGGEDTVSELIALLDERYRAHGLEVHWDDSFVKWVRDRRPQFSNERDWECFLDEHVAARLLEHVADMSGGKPRCITVVCNDDGVSVVEKSASKMEGNQ